MSFRPGSIARKFAAMALAATCSISGFAQTPAPPSTPQTTTQSQEIPPIEDRDLEIADIFVDAEERARQHQFFVRVAIDQLMDLERVSCDRLPYF